MYMLISGFIYSGYNVVIIYNYHRSTSFSNVYFSSIKLHFQPDLNHFLFIKLYRKAVHEYRSENCTGWTYTVGTTFSCQDDFSSVFCSQRCVLLILQYSIFGIISLTILYCTHIKAILVRIAWPLAPSIKIPWLVRTPLDQTTIDFFICTIFVTPHPVLHFQPDFDHYPLL